MPRVAFDPFKGGWGAFEVAGRYHELDFDDDAFARASRIRTVSAAARRAWTRRRQLVPEPLAQA